MTMESVIASLIAGGLTLIGVIITNMASNRQVEIQLQKNQAVTDTKLDLLTAEVKKHNNFASRMPVVEEQIRVLNHEVEEIKEKIG